MVKSVESTPKPWGYVYCCIVDDSPDAIVCRGATGFVRRVSFPSFVVLTAGVSRCAGRVIGCNTLLSPRVSRSCRYYNSNLNYTTLIQQRHKFVEFEEIDCNDYSTKLPQKFLIVESQMLSLHGVMHFREGLIRNG